MSTLKEYIREQIDYDSDLSYIEVVLNTCKDVFSGIQLENVMVNRYDDEKADVLADFADAHMVKYVSARIFRTGFYVCKTYSGKYVVIEQDDTGANLYCLANYLSSVEKEIFE